MAYISKDLKEKKFGYSYLFATYLGVTIAMNTAILTAQAGLEAVVNNTFKVEKQVKRAVLKKIGSSELMQTKGILKYGDFDVGNGETVRVHDSLRVLEGKLFPNSRLPSEINREYDIEIIGEETLGYTLLEARKVN